MISYLVKRLFLSIPILIGVNFITFILFFVVNDPNEVARIHLGEKYVTQESIDEWKTARGYDKPLFFNKDETGLKVFTSTLFFIKNVQLFQFEFGSSDEGSNITQDIRQRMCPSLAIAIPSLILGLIINIFLAFVVIFFRYSYLDTIGMIIAVMMMSISMLFFIIGGQYLLAKLLKWVPISGFDSGFSMWHFLILPILVSLLGGLGAGVRWYRTLFIEEMNQEYVRTARAKGLSEMQVLFKHVLRNALIPILTGVVVLVPFLFMGSLLVESFFGIPGLGSYTIDAISAQDFAIVRSMVFIGSLLYIIGLILTDIAYTWVDPRVTLV